MEVGDKSKNQPKPKLVNKDDKLHLIDADSVTKRQFFISASIITSLLASTIAVSYLKLRSQHYEIERRLNTKFETELATTRISINNNVSENIIFLKTMVLNPKIKLELARDIAKSIYRWGRVYDRDPDLMLALIKIESNFDQHAKSYMGAQGLTQIMPFWYEIFKEPNGKFLEVDSSIRYSHQILALYEKQYGTLEMALIAYNRGNHKIETDLLRGKNPRNDYADKIIKMYNHLKQLNIGG